MTGILDNLRDALLLTLVVVLLYILYKRLLRVLGKDAVSVPRFDLVQGSEQLHSTGFSCTLNIPESTELVIKIYLIPSGQVLHTAPSQSFVAGEHSISIQLDEIPRSSTVGVELISHNHKIYKRLRLD